MSRVVPSQFETDMARYGKRAGVDPIPSQIKSRPDEPGEYGGMYDEKPQGQFTTDAPADKPLEHKTSEPKSSSDHGSYQTRTSKAEVKKDDKAKAKDA